MIEFVIGLLLLLNVLQACFWGYQCQRLLNKLMSRNYAEYDLIASGPAVSEPKKEDPTDSLEEQAILNELNGLFKPIGRTA